MRTFKTAVTGLIFGFSWWASAQADGCAPKSAIMKTVAACYAGDMSSATSGFKYTSRAQVGRFEYCFNALVLPGRERLTSTIQVVQDNAHGEMRVQNFAVPADGSQAGGNSVALAGVTGRCASLTNVAGCAEDKTLAVTYSGTPGRSITIDAARAAEREKALKPLNENQNVDALKLALVDDIDQRIASAKAAIENETRSARTEALRQRRASSLLDCAAAAEKLRAPGDEKARAGRQANLAGIRSIAGLGSARPGGASGSGSSEASH